jgi:hypothetical protein
MMDTLMDVFDGSPYKGPRSGEDGDGGDGDEDKQMGDEEEGEELGDGEEEGGG